jgi:hypothetical protein
MSGMTSLKAISTADTPSRIKSSFAGWNFPHAGHAQEAFDTKLISHTSPQSKPGCDLSSFGTIMPVN